MQRHTPSETGSGLGPGLFHMTGDSSAPPLTPGLPHLRICLQKIEPCFPLPQAMVHSWSILSLDNPLSCPWTSCPWMAESWSIPTLPGKYYPLQHWGPRSHSHQGLIYRLSGSVLIIAHGPSSVKPHYSAPIQPIPANLNSKSLRSPGVTLTWESLGFWETHGLF